MKESVKEFIRQNIDLIDTNRWGEYYFNVTKALGHTHSVFDSEEAVGEMTELLLSCGVSPLDYLIRVPEYYLCGSQLETVELPKSVVSVGSMAFMNMPNLKHIVFSKKVNVLNFQCVAYCDSLESVVIESGECWFDESIFYMCPKLKHVTFGGTIETWNARGVILHDATVVCADGKLEYDSQGDVI